MEFFLLHKQIILRSLGAIMLLLGFVAYFWVTPKEGVSANAVAAANVARMEAKVSGARSTQSSAEPSSSKFVDKFQETRDKQLKYLTIIVMLFGIGFLLYSFMKKEEPEV